MILEQKPLNFRSTFLPFPQMLELINHAITDPEKDDVLNMVTYDFYQKYARPEFGVFTPLRTAIRPVLVYPFYISLEPVIAQLADSGIPHKVIRRPVNSGPQIGVKTYCFSLTEDKSRIQRYLIENVGSIPCARLRDTYMTAAS